jgi:hypothetical protein
MPSDPSGRHPLGVLIRPAPDWFDDHVGVGGFWVQGSFSPLQPHWLAVGLYNNASTGVLFKVYGITVAAEGGSGAGLYFVYGTFGTLVGQCSSLNPGTGNPHGLIYQNTQTALPNTVNPFFAAPPTMLIGSSGFDSATYFSPFPIAVIPAGYSLIATNMIFSDDVGFYFWYQESVE